VTDAYRMKDPRGWDWRGRLIDYGLLATALYPIATEKLVAGEFRTGGRTLLFPDLLKQPWVAWPVWAFRMLFFGQIHAGQHFFAFYSVMLSFLLVHYYSDHFIFLQRDRVITPSFAAP